MNPTNYQNNGYNYYQRPNVLKGYPVSSMEEARAANIDFDGTASLFPDIANHKIYTKQFNMDGTVSFKMFVEQKIEEPVHFNADNFITREEFATALQEIKKSLTPTQKFEATQF